MMKFDMHCHTKAGSIDARIPIEEYIAILKKYGYDGMLVTDHDTYKGYRYWSENCRKAKPVILPFCAVLNTIPRTPDTFSSLCRTDFFFPCSDCGGMSVEMLEKKIVHHFGGVLGPAHPFGPRSRAASLPEN